MSFSTPTACGLPANYTPVTSQPTSPPHPHGNGSGKSFNITLMALSYKTRSVTLMPLLPVDCLLITHLQHHHLHHHPNLMAMDQVRVLTLHSWPRVIKVSKVAKIRNRYNQVPHLTQDTNGKVTNSQKTPQTRAKRSALSQQVTTKHI